MAGILTGAGGPRRMRDSRLAGSAVTQQIAVVARLAERLGGNGRLRRSPGVLDNAAERSALPAGDAAAQAARSRNRKSPAAPETIGGNRRREPALSRGDRGHLATAMVLLTGLIRRLGSAHRAEAFPSTDPGGTGEPPTLHDPIARERAALAPSRAPRGAKVAGMPGRDGIALHRLADHLRALVAGARRTGRATVLASARPIAFRTAPMDSSAAKVNLRARRRETAPGVASVTPSGGPLQDRSRKPIAQGARLHGLTRLRPPMRLALATIEPRSRARAERLNDDGARGPLDGHRLLNHAAGDPRRARLARRIAPEGLAALLRTSLARSTPATSTSPRHEPLGASRNRRAHPAPSTHLVVNFSPTVELAGAATEDNLEQRVMAAIAQHSHELMRIMNNQLQSRQRAAFE